MKTIINRIIAIVVSFVLVVTSVGFTAGAYAAEDTEGPKVDLDSLLLSVYTISDPYEHTTAKMKVTDQSEIVEVSLYYQLNGKTNAAFAPLEYNPKTKMFEGEISYGGSINNGNNYGYYGKYELYYIVAVDAYGNYTYVENFEAPNGNFEVVGGSVEDKTPPVIDFDHIVVDKTVEKGDSAIMTLPITDESVILDGWVNYSSPTGGSAFSFITKAKDGTYQAKLDFQYAGEYHLDTIYVTDANYNDCYIRNSDYYGYVYDEYDDALIKGLGHLNIKYGKYVASKLTASIKSIALSSIIISRNEKGTLTVTFDASAPLKEADLSYDYVFARGNTAYETGAEVTKIDDYTFQFKLPNIYYGQWCLNNISVSDAKGNRVSFYDPQQSTLTKGIATDLSDANYHVGIIDSETGLGVSDREFDKTTKLEVDEESVDSSLGQDMVEEDAIGVGMYDVEVKGKRDDKTTVSFVAPEGFRDGDKVDIVHKRHDGTNETFEAEVKHGRITVETDEFSPFVVQVDKNHKHRYSAKKIVTKATFAKSGSYLKKCYACDKTTGEKLKLKAAKVSLTKDSFEYTGKYISSKKLPKITVKDGNGRIISSEYYTVTKPKNVKKMKAIGRYPYKITFKKNCEKYKGSKTIYLQIKPKKTFIMSWEPTKKAITVNWKKGKKAQVTGYQIMAATNNKFTKNKKTLTVKGYNKGSKKITKLKAKTKYYFKIRTYKTVNGVKIYSDWSKAKTIKTK